MKIAQVAPLYEAVPPKLYGGTERIVSALTDALVARGHDVTLFASGESKSGAKLIASRGSALRLDPSPYKSDIAAHLNMLAQVKNRADQFDLIHFHTDLLHFPMFEEFADKTLTTVHGRLDLEGLREVFQRWSKYPLISISDSQRNPLNGANWRETIHHGLPGDWLVPTHRPRGDYLAFIGRISPEKGVDRAIRIAQAAGMPLRIAAKVSRDDQDYFYDSIEPMLQLGDTELIGEIGEKDKPEFLGNAAALLFPIDWPEPFGLAMIEAMACGTPVIAWRNGSVPEIIEDGVTGFIVSDEAAAVEEVARASKLDRGRIRQVFERRFSADRMADNYVVVYEGIMRRPTPFRRAVTALPWAGRSGWHISPNERIAAQEPLTAAEYESANSAILAENQGLDINIQLNTQSNMRLTDE
jgi:glycosyltransferase involved in cell wall biosynthesis